MGIFGRRKKSKEQVAKEKEELKKSQETSGNNLSNKSESPSKTGFDLASSFHKSIRDMSNTCDSNGVNFDLNIFSLAGVPVKKGINASAGIIGSAKEIVDLIVEVSREDERIKKLILKAASSLIQIEKSKNPNFLEDLVKPKRRSKDFPSINDLDKFSDDIDSLGE